MSYKDKKGDIRRNFNPLTRSTRQPKQCFKRDKAKTKKGERV